MRISDWSSDVCSSDLFVSGTSFAPTDAAGALIRRVAAIHRQVRGIAPDGSAYAADDPELLAWVHVTEMASFLRGYAHYCRSDQIGRASCRERVCQYV